MNIKKIVIALILLCGPFAVFGNKVKWDNEKLILKGIESSKSNSICAINQKYLLTTFNFKGKIAYIVGRVDKNNILWDSKSAGFISSSSDECKVTNIGDGKILAMIHRDGDSNSSDNSGTFSKIGTFSKGKVTWSKREKLGIVPGNIALEKVSKDKVIAYTSGRGDLSHLLVGKIAGNSIIWDKAEVKVEYYELTLNPTITLLNHDRALLMCNNKKGKLESNILRVQGEKIIRDSEKVIDQKVFDSSGSVILDNRSILAIYGAENNIFGKVGNIKRNSVSWANSDRFIILKDAKNPVVTKLGNNSIVMTYIKNKSLYSIIGVY